MTRMIAWITAGALLTLGGCNKKSENPPPSTGASGGTAMTAGSAGAAGSAMGSGSASGSAGSGSAGSGSASGSGSAAAAEADVPTEMDFEENARTKITDKNVEAEVQALEKQLQHK
ncbi:MAG TPA: hypothetical protein VFT22_24285 [Kofleriaceae bacterium]|nr:hypothetical protein [Kofleriaceae bacterium]